MAVCTPALCHYLQLHAIGLVVDAQLTRGFGLVAAGPFERFDDRIALDLTDLVTDPPTQGHAAGLRPDRRQGARPVTGQTAGNLGDGDDSRAKPSPRRHAPGPGGWRSGAERQQPR